MLRKTLESRVQSPESRVQSGFYTMPFSIDRDPVHVYKMYKEKLPPSMLEPDSSFYLSAN